MDMAMPLPSTSLDHLPEGPSNSNARPLYHLYQPVASTTANGLQTPQQSSHQPPAHHNNIIIISDYLINQEEVEVAETSIRKRSTRRV